MYDLEERKILGINFADDGWDFEKCGKGKIASYYRRCAPNSFPSREGRRSDSQAKRRQR